MLIFVPLLACNSPDPGRAPHKEPTGSSSVTGTLLPDTPPDPGDPDDSGPPHDDTGPEHQPDPDELAGPVVLFVHVDTLRADRLSGYGYPRETLPMFMARGPEVVPGLRGNSAWTAPAVATVLSGLYPYQHGLLTVVDADRGITDYPLTAPTVAETFLNNGWLTLLATGNGFLNPSNGLTTGFDSVLSVGGGSDNHLSGLVDVTLAWLDGAPRALPLFIMVQPMDPHGPYHPADEDRGIWADRDVLPVSADSEVNPTDAAFMQAFAAGSDPVDNTIAAAINDTYDETLLGLDRALEQLIAGIEADGREVVVVVSADHGETLNDDGTLYWGHGATLRPELVTLPFLVWGAPEPIDVPDGCLWESIDVPNYLLHLAGLPSLSDVDGVLPGEWCRDRVHAELWDPNYELRELVVEDMSWRYTWSCVNLAATVTSVLDDPSGVDPLPDTAIPDRAPFEAERDRLLTEFEAFGGRCGSETP